jgi:hypothetical protein
MCGEGEIFELIGLRTRVEVLEQDLSQATHVLYCWLTLVAESPASEFKDRMLGTIRAKFLQMPQGFALGRALMDLDSQFGGALQAHGLRLERWVFEPRGRFNG